MGRRSTDSGPEQRFILTVRDSGGVLPKWVIAEHCRRSAAYEFTIAFRELVNAGHVLKLQDENPYWFAND